MRVKKNQIKKIEPEKFVCTSSSSSSGVSGNKNNTSNIKELSNRKKRVLDIFASNDSQGLIMNIETKLPSQKFQAIKRQFPGPAGILPDKLDVSTRNLNYLYIHDANETKNFTTLNDSRSKDFCIQDTKELFSHGAWQIMINDLPKNLLQNHNIMSIKLSNVEKVSILACIIKKIDYNTESPRVILKDISDTIEGLMSREVPIKFPNILQPGVVIILKDANCFTFKGKNWRKNKLLMITTKSLIGIYGKNSRLVSTPILDEILK
ncbi:uncharacterized protein LOC122856466, partial [Aphidius gifuensis]|uniref:uncharacterized protein LOC122856466 n=1 Tax=Aphidius gifuensis TaxID=684658 RepID=UPI001CDC2CAB